MAEFNIQIVDGRMPKEIETSKDDVTKGGIWYVANFMTGYEYYINEDGVEGDSKMYKEFDRC